MPSLQIKDYIIAGLLLGLLWTGAQIGYYKIDAGIAHNELNAMKVQKEAAELRNKNLKRATDKEKENIDAEHAKNMANINLELERLRNRPSILPPITITTKDPARITFDRDKLDRAIQGYRRSIQGLIGEGAKCEDSLNELRKWWSAVDQRYKENAP